MITLLLMNLAKYVFYAILDCLKAIDPSIFTTMTNSLASLMGQPFARAGLYLVEAMVPIDFLMGMFTTSLMVIMSVKLFRFVWGKIDHGF